MSISPVTCKKLLTEARKYRLGLTLAHQFVYQLEEAGEAIYHAVQSCTHSKVVFTIQSAQEAQDLAHDVLPLSLETPCRRARVRQRSARRSENSRTKRAAHKRPYSEMRARHHARSTGTTVTESEQRSRGSSHGNSVMRGSGSAAISGSGVSAGTVDGAKLLE